MNGNYFEQLAAKYDAWFKTPHGQYVKHFEHEMTMSLTDVRPGMYIADIGCGTGLYTQELCRLGAKVVGVDISPEMLAIAARKTHSYANCVEFLEGDATALPFADNSFDRVFSITAIEFFEKPQPCLHEMYRILRPGGHMIVATLNSLCLWAVQRRIKSWFSRTVFSHAKFHSIFDMQRMLKPHRITRWRGGIFIPPFAPHSFINSSEAIESVGQHFTPHLGAFIVARVDK